MELHHTVRKLHFAFICNCQTVLLRSWVLLSMWFWLPLWCVPKWVPNIWLLFRWWVWWWLTFGFSWGMRYWRSRMMKIGHFGPNGHISGQTTPVWAIWARDDIFTNPPGRQVCSSCDAEQVRQIVFFQFSSRVKDMTHLTKWCTAPRGSLPKRMTVLAPKTYNAYHMMCKCVFRKIIWSQSVFVLLIWGGRVLAAQQKKIWMIVTHKCLNAPPPS